MSYTENLKTCTDEYEALLKDFEEKVSSEKYATAIAAAPFEFISAIHVCELLEAFNSDSSSVMKFDSAKDAAATYAKIIGFKQKKDEVLEMADTVAEVGRDADKINDLVSSNPYLPNSLKVAKDETNCDFAERAIKMGSRYDDLLSRKFRDRFTESCIESLPVNELDELVANGIIRERHMDNIVKTGTPVYEERFKHLCVDVFGREDVSLGKYEQPLKGVTFENPDGVSRQSILKEMDEKIKAGETLNILASIEEYIPELGKPEPSVRITWNSKTIGFLPKESAKQISEMSNRPIRLQTKLEKITGGGDVLYGVTVEVDVREMIKSDPTLKSELPKDVVDR